MKKASLFFLISVFLALSGCGGAGSGSNLSGKYSVEDVNILANDIRVGERVRVEVFFESKIEPDGSPDGADVVVRIPPELAFISNTSQLYDNSTDNSDFYPPNSVVDCPTGEVFLVYRFSDFDLSDRELGLFGRFGLKFEAQGLTPISQTLVGAIAGKDINFNCGQFFDAEQNEAIRVLP